VELRPYQKESLSALWDWFRKNPQGAPLLVLPTGAGKSLVIAEAAKKVAERGKRVLILAHRRELLSQNYDKLAALMPFGNLGLYSAGLGRRDTSSDIVVAGIQSAYTKAEELGSFALVLIDEVHLVPPDGEGRYQTLINGLTAINPGIRFAGTTATPYRLGSGVLTTSGNLWTGIAHEVGIRELINQGYLSPLVSKGGTIRPNMKNIAIRAGEYVAEAMENAFNRLDLVEAAVEEIVAFGTSQDRKSWLIFSSGVKHAETIGEVLKRVGIKVGVVTGDTPPLFREQILQDFKAGELQALVNCDVLTTGFDHPGIDLIAVLRATQSTGLWVQICGRGCRIAEGKKDCLILDFGENALRHGPIDRIRLAYRTNPLTGKDETRVETIPCKECPHCKSLVVSSEKECGDCGYVWPDTMRLNHKPEASTASVLYQPEFKEFDVLKVVYDKHKKRDGDSVTMRVDYVMGEAAGVVIDKISEWVCLEHEGFAQRKAVSWWRMHAEDPTQDDYPDTVAEGLKRVGELKTPKRIRAQKDGKWWRVVKVLEWAKPVDAAADEDTLADEMGVNL
jgi:DNA repair protein RadD